MKRISDQTLVLISISDIRIELKTAYVRGDSNIEMNEIMLRLTSMYACLDVIRVAEFIAKHDKRAQQGKKVA